MSNSAAKKVLVVGGGFGGIKAALELSDDELMDVTLLSDKASFRFYPTLFHTATGGRSSESSIPLETIFDGKKVNIVIGEATIVDKTKKTVTTEDGPILSFDILIFSLGVVTNFFGIKGLDKYAFGIKSVEDARRLKNHLHDQLTDKKEPDLNYVVIGGGPTGIELAGQLPEYLHHIMKRHGIKHRSIHIDLVEAAPTLVPRLPKVAQRTIARRLRKLGIRLYLKQAVQAETADALMVSGKPIRSHTVIWTAGVTNHPFFKDNGFPLTDRGKVIVDEYLQASPDIYVLGDNANTTYSGMAQTAVYDGLFVSNNLKREERGLKKLTYKPKQPITVIPAGSHWTEVVAGRLHLNGRLGWLLREAADYVAFHEMEPWWKAGAQWLTEFGEEESCPICFTHDSKSL